MAYLCTRCEADEHPELPEDKVRNILGLIEEHGDSAVFNALLYCEGCSSNTHHLSDGGNIFDDDNR